MNDLRPSLQRQRSGTDSKPRSGYGARKSETRSANRMLLRVRPWLLTTQDLTLIALDSALALDPYGRPVEETRPSLTAATAGATPLPVKGKV
jgi:hypothetical protein